MQKFSSWLNKKMFPKNENVAPELFSAVTNPANLQDIMDLLAQNPELLPNIEKFKQENAKSFDSSVRNFNSNSVELRHLMKLAQGKPLTFYDWM